MRAPLAILVLAVAPASCVRQVQVSKSPAVPRAAAPTVWERQVRNAKDAGDGDYQLRALRNRVAAEPDNVAVRLELAKAYGERGYPDVALEICRLTTGRFPESGEAQLALVGALRDLRRPADAIQALDTFLHAHPQTGPQFYSWLGILHDDTGKWAEGEAAHRRALELGPNLDYLHNNLGYNLLMQEKYDDAAGEFREALKRNPASQVARNNLGLALARQGSGSDALAAWQSGADPAAAHNNLAVVLIEKGNFPAARKELELALGYNKTFPAALKNLELVSRLDGSPVVLDARQERTRWERWKVGFKRLWVGPLEDSHKEPLKTASASASGEDK